MGDKKTRSVQRLRKQLLVYPRFQLALIGVNAAIMSLAFFFVGIQTTRSFARLHTLGVEAGLPLNHAYYKFVEFQEQHLNGYLAVALILTLITGGILTLVLSHRVAGPITRLRSYFLDLTHGGSIRPISFRKGDFFSDLPGLINQSLAPRMRKKGAASTGRKKAA